MSLAPLPGDSLIQSPEYGWSPVRHGLPLPLGSRWGHLALEECTAFGSFGTVYRAIDHRLHIDVALKLTNSARPSHDLDIRLLQEAARLSCVRHPGIVKMYGAAIKRGRAGLWMEFLHGRTLDDVLRDEGALDACEVARIGRDLCAALNVVHAAGLFHGDIKPQNVVREDSGRVVMIDFGSASELAVSTRSSRPLTGTPLYVAPEVLNEGTTSVASDIYSLGVLLFHLASKTYPVRADTVEGLARALECRDVKRLKDVRSDLPDHLCQLVDRALNVDPRGRFRCAADMHHALARIAS
jgi:serine/threonine protein kinase